MCEKILTATSEGLVLAPIVTDGAYRTHVLRSSLQAMPLNPLRPLVIVHGLHHHLRHDGTGSECALSIDTRCIPGHGATVAEARSRSTGLMADHWLTRPSYPTEVAKL